MTKTNALESLVIAGFIRGLSVRDVEATLAEALGPEATVGKSTVARVCSAIKAEFDAFKERDLSEVELEYLFLDGSHFKMHPGAKAEPVLVAWGVDTAGKPVLLGLEPGSTESTDAWAGLDVVEDRPVVRLDLLVGVGGDLGQREALDFSRFSDSGLAGHPRFIVRRIQDVSSRGGGD